jgi:hypothetical protein
VTKLISKFKKAELSKKIKVLIAVLVVLLLMQLIRPARNLAEAESANDINHAIEVPAEVKNILVTACYDCHSNHTNYPWYCYVQPIGLWTGHHVNEGKQELNFSEFNSYTQKRKAHKLKGIVKLVKADAMPLPSYLWIHKEAVLKPEQKDLLVAWADKNRKALGDSSAFDSKP